MTSRAWLVVALLGCKSSGSTAPAAGTGSGSAVHDAGKSIDALVAPMPSNDAAATKSIDAGATAVPMHEPHVEGEMDGPSPDDLAGKNQSDDVEQAILDAAIAEEQKANPKFSRDDALAAIGNGGGPRVAIPPMMRRVQAECALAAQGLDAIAVCLKPRQDQK